MGTEVGEVWHRAMVIGDYLYYEEYKVAAVTPHGIWLENSYLRTWRSFDTKFARPTKEGALESCKRRALANLKHCRRRLRDAEQKLAVLSVEVPREMPLLHRGRWEF